MPSRTTPLLVTILFLGLVASELDAQVRRGRAEETPRWAPLAVGVRAGYDQRANAWVLGSLVKIPVVRSGIMEVVPSADMAFLRGSKDYQYALEVAWIPAGVRGGAFLTGGVAWRDTPVDAMTPGDRNTFFGYVVGAGAKTRAGPVEVEVGIRWTFLTDTTYRPNTATVGVNLPFWSVDPEGGR